MSYNLDQEAPESFEFTLGGNVYQMRYPNSEEIAAGQAIEDTKLQEEWMYAFISPVDAKAPSIKEALSKVNIKVLQKFNHMIKTEFEAE